MSVLPITTPTKGRAIQDSHSGNWGLNMVESRSHRGESTIQEAAGCSMSGKADKVTRKHLLNPSLDSVSGSPECPVLSAFDRKIEIFPRGLYLTLCRQPLPFPERDPTDPATPNVLNCPVLSAKSKFPPPLPASRLYHQTRNAPQPSTGLAHSVMISNTRQRKLHFPLTLVGVTA